MRLKLPHTITICRCSKSLWKFYFLSLWYFIKGFRTKYVNDRLVQKNAYPFFLSFVALQYRSPWRRRFAALCVCPDGHFLSSTKERASSACLSRIMGIKLFLLIYLILILFQGHNCLYIISKSKNLARMDMNLFILLVWIFMPLTAEILVYLPTRCWCVLCWG